MEPTRMVPAATLTLPLRLPLRLPLPLPLPPPYPYPTPRYPQLGAPLASALPPPSAQLAEQHARLQARVITRGLG